MNIINLEITMIARSFCIFTFLALLGVMSAGVRQAKADGPFYPVKENGLWRYIDQTGTVVIKPRFEQVGDFSEGLARVKIGGRWAYLDQTLNIRIEPKFQDARDFSAGLAAVLFEGKWGYIDQKGKFVIVLEGKRIK